MHVKKSTWNTGICGCHGDKTFNCYTKMLLIFKTYMLRRNFKQQSNN